jgi:hypothetical protein
MDKAAAASAVQVVTRWILARLRHTALADVHAADGVVEVQGDHPISYGQPP